jgi:hypothetical protein
MISEQLEELKKAYNEIHLVSSSSKNDKRAKSASKSLAVFRHNLNELIKEYNEARFPSEKDIDFLT